jgi:CheY-like chemotaxis protein
VKIAILLYKKAIPGPSWELQLRGLAEMEKQATGQERPSARTILVVDDDHDARTLLADLLGDEGYDVVEAPNGKVAIDYLLAAPARPGLVLLDLNMPLMCGWEVIRIMRGDVRLSQIPVALVTSEPPGFPGETIVGHLHKPYATEDVLALVRRHLPAEPLPDTGAAA